MPTVSVLNFSGSPSAVLWRIWAIVINAVYAVFGRWTLAHIRQKYQKVISPLITDGYTAPTVVWIIFVIYRIAALKQIAPSAVFRRIGKTMYKMILPCLFVFPAPARFYYSKISALNFFDSSAIAPAVPILPTSKPKYNKAMVSIPGYIFKARMIWNRCKLNIAHGISLNNVVRSGADVYGIRSAHYTTAVA